MLMAVLTKSPTSLVKGRQLILIARDVILGDVSVYPLHRPVVFPLACLHYQLFGDV